jgi:hypothetical protein
MFLVESIETFPAVNYGVHRVTRYALPLHNGLRMKLVGRLVADLAILHFGIEYW